MSTKMKQHIEWRRAKVIGLLSKGGSNQSGITRILQVDKSIICRDIYHTSQLEDTGIAPSLTDTIKQYVK
jgi:hypothetical protein